MRKDISASVSLGLPASDVTKTLLPAPPQPARLFCWNIHGIVSMIDLPAWTGRSCCAHNWHWSAICPRNVLLTTGQLPHSQPLAPDRPILVSHTDIVSPYRLTCYWTVAIHEGQSCWSVSEKTHFMRPCMEQSLLSTVTCRMYTVFRKKHPLTFSFISPWMMCWFKQKLQWIYPRKGSFWQCKN